ncbi:tRNA 2-thiouridine(34) synthase MnmA [Candidatus Fermentibacteria bacterium]|nr:tRNA 2-thiouridine(34) synthase MnmA [Candidatus Fermentibacteria bacterium]
MPERGGLVALSGGMDSALALHLSLRRFDAVRAAYVHTGHGSPDHARKVACHLGVNLEEIDAVSQFEGLVAEPSRRMAENGLTPNPCALCNDRVKLGLTHSLLRNGETLVTGHYARVEKGRLLRGMQRRKDQSYFLSMVEPSVLARTWLPLGTWRKERVREEVRRLGIPAGRRESMDLCFDVSGSRPEDGGEIVDLSTGEVVGEHHGLSGFTVGQRRGIGAHGRRMYVVSLDPVSARVYVGGGSDLMCSGCRVSDIVVHQGPLPEMFGAEVQVRYRHRPAPARIVPVRSGLDVRFERPVRAVAPGQVGVVYDSDNVLVAGTITRAVRLGGELEA